MDLYFLATELAKDDNFAVSFITADYDQEKIETIEAVRIIKSLDFKKNPLSGAIRVWQALRKADAQMYMIKTISPGMFLVAFFCRLYRKVFLFRTSNTNTCDGTYLSRHLLLGNVFKWALRTAELVFVQNKTDKENLKRTTGVTSIAISNGHRLAKLARNKHDAILWIGRSAKIKKPELFIDLAEKIPDEKFTMICQRATGDKKYDELLARAKQVANLKFIEQVGFDEIDSYFQRAKVFVNTSQAEGFPNTFIQACRYAVPILSLNVNPDGFLNRYNCGLSCNGQLQKLADSLVFMLEENRYIELGKKAREYVEEHHDVTRIVKQYKKMFMQIAERNSKNTC